MPALQPAPPQASGSNIHEEQLHFPPVTRDHILHCSYDYWFPKYRTSCIRSRIIPLTPDFLSYLHEDGIILADSFPTDPDHTEDEDDWVPTAPSTPFPRPPEAQSPYDSDSDSESSPSKPPPNLRFPDLHNTITAAIAALGGAVCPKLNWSSPKDATWISSHPNTMKCTSANDVYLLLKSSSFITHDLEHAFDDTIPSATHSSPFAPVLVLRSYFNPLTSLEFRCFVKDRNLVAITQRDLRHYDFLESLRPAITSRVKELFNKMRFTFPDACWVFDVYIPEADYDPDSDSDSETNTTRLGKARLIDINPWAPRTDTLLFDWGELLGIQVARPFLGANPTQEEGAGDEEGTTTESEWEEEVEDHEPELRLVERDDPAAYSFSSAPYSAHKLPKDVVDASMAGDGGMREFAQRWRQMTEGRVEEIE
ncbi:D123-domain-containing protein [Podospora aff. communis PSN243]|uniref:D123-domain-containing protein n=1 Tax=Podospora aff. communis PSN243 TaxID=3040156 RepID=A0AAV9G6I1_9PEZI|nr:D123-domain-containing protein [Podospora aff. communis PSN243]